MTDDLIERLAEDLEPVSPRRPLRRLLLAVGVAAGAGLLAFLVLPDLAFRADLVAALHGVSFWLKLAFTGALAAIGAWAMAALSRPAARDPGGPVFAAIVWSGFAAIALAVLAATPPADWQALVMGETARRCVGYILLLSVPLLALMLAVMRRAAPTRLGRAGWACGLAAGGLAASVYSLGCGEASPVFLVIWYGLGIAATGLTGAAAGRWALRW
ncbi:DUF1109 domain-containing protein [Maricaulis sp.]|uniref:DUF1109 domain-containing protein n=1 Tax=Maricaulis sp. TaxID=1486257 RepID=UPI002607FD4F|nr:DUF1109 domain-containing protein [Maricaulis sp.]